MARLHVILIFLTVGCSISNAKIYNLLKPDNPVVNPGGELVVNCTLMKDPPAGFTSNNVQFTLAGKYVNDTYITPLDNETAQLRIPNMTEEFNQKYMMCRLNYSTILGMQVITIRIEPQAVNITKCVVKQSSMQCDWSPTSAEQAKYLQHHVTDKLTWSILGNDSWYACPRQKMGSCIWPSDQFVEDAVYIVNVNSSYRHHSASVNFTINSAHIIQVEQVAMVNVRHISPTSVELEWPPTGQHRDVIYHVQLSKSSLGYENVTELVTTNHLTLDGLTPFQPYVLTIKAKTKEYGYWSVPLERRFFSMSGVPARNPEVTKGGFSVSERPGDPCIEVTVYWKTIPELLKHGPAFHYEVSVDRIGRCIMGCFSTNKEANDVEITIPKDCAIDVTVKSVNVNGTPTDPAIPVRIGSSKNRISGPENITVIASRNGENVTVSWNPEPNDTATTGFTVYWSRRHSDPDAEMNWRSVPTSTHQVILPLVADESGKYDFTKYSFAISREAGTRSSGMLISECTYESGQYSSPPHEFAISKTVSLGYGELAVEWSQPQCSSHRGYVYGYKLRFCMTEESSCSKDNEAFVFVRSPQTGFILSGLKEHARYCVSITSLTAQGPSRWYSDAMCATLPGAWWTTGRIIGFTIAGILLLLLGAFGVIKFGSHCHRLYSKFQQGLRVEVPRGPYSTQFSVSSHRELIDQNNSFIYNVEDFSSPSLAKQHSQESTADSGRGSMSQDHIHHPVRRTNSGESDDVFLRNSLQANGISRIRQSSEPMSGYARVMPNNGSPDIPSGSTCSLGSPHGKTNLPPRKSPDGNTLPGSMSSLPQHYNLSSPASGSIPSYVMVGGNSQHGEHYKPNEKVKDNSPNSSPISDYARAKGDNQSLTYALPENNEQDYISPTAAANQVPPHGYVANPNLANQGTPLGYVTSPQAVGGVSQTNIKRPDEGNHKAPVGYVSSPQAANCGAPLGYVTNPEVPNQGAPHGYIARPEEASPGGYVTSPEAVCHGASLGYVPKPEEANPGGYVTSPQAANHGPSLGYLPRPVETNPGGYVTNPKAANPGPPQGYVTSPGVANHGASLGYITSPEVSNPGDAFGYVTSPEEAQQGTDYVSMPDAANQGSPLDYVKSPQEISQAPASEQVSGSGAGSKTAGASSPVAQLGYVSSPNVANMEYVANPNASFPRNNVPSDYVTTPEDVLGKARTQGSSDPRGYVSPEEAGLSQTMPASQGGYVPAPKNSSDYVSTNDTPSPVAVSTPISSNDNSLSTFDLKPSVLKSTSSDKNKDSSSICKPKQLEAQPLASNQPYIAPYSTYPEYNNDSNQVTEKGALNPNSDSNHNNVMNNGSYVQLPPSSAIEQPADASLLQNDMQPDLSEETDETSSLLPSDGGRKVLNKSGYVVIDT